MRLKLLLAMLFVSGGFLLAQDTIKTLIITEAKLDRADQAYIELTNVGDDALNLKDFEITSIDPWTAFPDTAQFPINAPQPSDDRSIERMPDYVLAPGESYVIAALSDQTERTYAKDVAKYGYSQDWGPYLTNPKLVPLIDLPEYRNEGPSRINDYGDRDSVSTGSADRTKNFSNLLEDWDGRNCMFIRHHISDTDSAVVDQINGVWGDPDNSNPDAGNLTVAGVDKTGGNYVLIRNFKVKQGNVVFQVGTDIENSEWIPIPFLGSRIEVGVRDTYGEHSRGPFWTVGNHLDAHLTDLYAAASPELELDMATMTIKVPWGIRNNDSIMSFFNYTPGIAWHYDFAHTYEDSAFSSIRTGDSLTLYAVGNTLEMAKLKLEVKDPLVTENRVIPKYRPMQNEKNTRFFGSYIYVDIPYVVTDGLVTDTISEIPFATRTDTLLKYLEKPENASWEFVWVDGEERTDLKDGDILQVTAEDGTSVKDYYLKVQKYRKDRSFYLSSITWPDISEVYKAILGWDNDTIPGFESGVANYVVEMPSDLTGVPALVGKTEDQNAKLEVKRAVNLSGTTADRSFTFTVTAENDTVWKTYSVELVKRKATENIQPWPQAEPFISQWVFRDQWSNTFLEVVNPGTDVLDLSHYMLFFGYEQTSADAIEAYDEATFYDPATGEDGDFDNRYRKYIPGRVWVDTAEWAANPATCEQDLSVKTMIQPGDVFVIGDVNGAGTAAGSVGYGTLEAWPMMDATDIFLTNTFYVKPNGDTVYFSNWPDRAAKAFHSLDSWWGEHIYLFKILNDSVRDGTKAATNPNDFQLLDVWGAEGNNDQPTIGGVLMNQLYAYTRKPEIYKGNPVLEGSWGDTIVTADTTLYPEQTTEWIMVNDAYYSALGEGWAFNILKICDGFGSHFMNEVTVYKSTVNSNAYIVSEGYSMDEEIRGATTGTTVDQFLANINKVDTGQTLIVKSAGVEIEGGTALTNGDSLVVISADSTNKSMYFIEITDEGLNSDAVLTSETYTIIAEPAEDAQVGGFDLGTLLKDVVEGVNVPFGAAMNVINSKDQLVPLKTIRFDTAYVDVLATSDVYFEVTSEDKSTTIVYQLMPNGDESDAWVTSSVFDVDQNLRQIKLIPDGTTVDALYANLTPSNGASMILVDKLGYERTEGMVVGDDQLVVTAADGVTTNAYVLLMLHGTATYLAYVLSDVYTVDQDLLTISGSGVTVDLSVTDFLANLLPSTGSTMEVQDNTGAGKAGADMLADEDQLHVLAANGVAFTDYSIILSTGVADQGIDNLSIYPNPTSGQFYIDGLEPGLRIRVYNAVGVALRNITAHSSNEQISLDDQPNGMYYITVSNGDDVIGRYKVIKQ